MNSLFVVVSLALIACSFAATPTCADFVDRKDLSVLGPVAPWGPLTIRLTPEATLYRLSPYVSFNSTEVSIIKSEVWASGCNATSSNLDIVALKCSGTVWTASTSFEWINENTNEVVPKTLDLTPVHGAFEYLWIAQNTNVTTPNITTCTFPASVSFNGTNALECFAGRGVFNYVNGSCNCTAGYAGATCFYSGVCDPTANITECSTNANSTALDGLRNCVVDSTYTTHWSACKVYAGAGESASHGVYIGIAIAGVAVGIIGLIIGYVLSRRRNDYQAV